MKRCSKHKVAIFVKSVIIAFSFMVVTSVHSKAQEVNEKNSMSGYKEYALLHVAQTGYLSGETIWFKVYVIQQGTGRLSPISKIAYVELVNKEGTSVLQQKIEIENGLGYGALTIPQNIVSGSYQIRSYVNVQKNAPEAIYSSSMHIFNPSLLPASVNERSQYKGDIDRTYDGKEENNAIVSKTKINGFRVSGLDRSFGLREEVKVAFPTNSVSGQFSVAVFKKDEFENHEIDSIWNTPSLIGRTNTTTDSREYLNEYAGHLVTGTVMDKNTGKLLSGVRVNLIVDGERFFLGTAKSDKHGVVLFNIGKPYGAEHLTLQVPDLRDSNAVVQLQNPFITNFRHAVAPKDFFSKEVKQALQLRVVNQNLQKAFSLQSSTSYFLPHFNDSTLFYGKPDKTYYLDDYTRFNTMEEVLREYVTEVELRKQSQQYKFAVLDIPNKRSFDNNPLVLIDGVPTTDMNRVVAFDPLKVKRMDVVARKFFMGDLSFDGIVSLITYSGDLGGLELDPQSIIVDYQGLSLIRQFEEIKFNKDEISKGRIPDLRSLLYWNPKLEVKKEAETVFSFYTSDLAGEFVMVVRGVDENGKLVNQIHPFSVIH
jgi:hypothetical protein